MLGAALLVTGVLRIFFATQLRRAQGSTSAWRAQ